MSKECVYCGEINEDDAKSCVVCGASFGEEHCKVQNNNNFNWSITCPKCGHVYEVKDETSRIRECEYCDDEFDRIEISRILPRKKEKSEPNESQPSHCSKETTCSVLILNEPRKNERIEIASNGMIGREGDIDKSFFEKDPFVSEEHCTITIDDGVWRVEHIGKCNPTVVNTTVLKNGFPVVLKNGDLLRIADLYFRVSIETKKADETCERTCLPDLHRLHTAEAEWEVICPICGKRYMVASENARIQECTGACRFDDFDKYEIAATKPRKVRH